MGIKQHILHAWQWWFGKFDEFNMTHSQQLWISWMVLILLTAVAVVILWNMHNLMVALFDGVNQSRNRMIRGTANAIDRQLTRHRAPRKTTRPVRPTQPTVADVRQPLDYPPASYAGRSPTASATAKIPTPPVAAPEPPTQPTYMGTPLDAHSYLRDIRQRMATSATAATKPPPLNPAATDREAWERINKLVAYFRAEAAQRSIPHNATSPGEGALIVDLHDQIKGRARFNSVVANAPGWTTQDPPDTSGPMEVYITDTTWEVVGSYPVFDASGAATFRTWRMTSRTPGQSQVHKHPRSQRELGVTVRQAHDLVEQFILDMLDPRY